MGIEGDTNTYGLRQEDGGEDWFSRPGRERTLTVGLNDHHDGASHTGGLSRLY